MAKQHHRTIGVGKFVAQAGMDSLNTDWNLSFKQSNWKSPGLNPNIFPICRPSLIP